MLRRLSLSDFVIVASLDVEFDAGFTVLTGETGAGKSILVDALQLALGSRGEAIVVREGAKRCEISAEFDVPAALAGWLDDAGFESAGTLLLRRTIDTQGRSRAWINGGAATVAQLREVADSLVDIHGQHAWQSLTRPAAVRTLLDGHAGIDAAPLGACFQRWQAAGAALHAARDAQADLERERERLAWQIAELDRLAPAEGEWETLDADHRRLANAQALIDAARGALDAIAEGEADASASIGRAIDALDAMASIDAQLGQIAGVLRDAQAQLGDAAHSLGSYLNRTEPEPDRLAALDARLSAWMSLARRWRRPPAELPLLLAQWKAELRALDAAADLEGLQRALDAARTDYDREAARVSAARRAAAHPLAAAVTQGLQQLGMAGGRFEIVLAGNDAPQGHGRESAEFLVAGHAGATPRPLAKVASGGELSRIALAIAVTTAGASNRAPNVTSEVPTLIFDEVDAGVGGAVAETVGALMKQLGRAAAGRQVLAVTHLPQVAACADAHLVVSKVQEHGAAQSRVEPVAGEARVAEIARMLGGERLSGTSRAHAQELLAVGAETAKRKRSR